MYGNRVLLHTVTNSAAAEYDTKEEKNENNSYHSRKDKRKIFKRRYRRIQQAAEPLQTPDQVSETVEDNIRAKEGERLMKHIRDDMYVITLEIGGKMLSSEEFAEKIETLGVQGKSSIAFVIGGSIGLGKEVLKRSDFALSFSKMTFPHQLMRVILLEQVYRAYRIMNGEPYHK